MVLDDYNDHVITYKDNIKNKKTLYTAKDDLSLSLRNPFAEVIEEENKKKDDGLDKYHVDKGRNNKKAKRRRTRKEMLMEDSDNYSDAERERMDLASREAEANIAPLPPIPSLPVLPEPPSAKLTSSSLTSSQDLSSLYDSSDIGISIGTREFTRFHARRQRKLARLERLNKKKNKSHNNKNVEKHPLNVCILFFLVLSTDCACFCFYFYVFNMANLFISSSLFIKKKPTKHIQTDPCTYFFVENLTIKHSNTHKCLYKFVFIVFHRHTFSFPMHNDVKKIHINLL